MAITNVSRPILVPEASRRPRRWTYAFAALSGLALVGAFPHLDCGALAWIALVPVLLTFPHARFRDAPACGAIFGVFFFGGLLSWLAVFAGRTLGLPLGVVAWLIGTLAQTLIVVAWAGGTQILARQGGWAWRLGVPALWTVGEWVRQLGVLGTGWGDLAYTQHSWLAMLQWTKLAGVWGLSFLIVMVNVALAEAIQQRRAGRWTWATAGIVGIALLYGTATLRTENLRPTFVAAALQGNLNQDVPWRGLRPADPAYVKRVMETYARQGREAAATNARLTVWPETMFPGYLRLDDDLRTRIAADAVANHQAILIGGNDLNPRTKKDANALFLVTQNGQIAGAYAKQQLVPFGEFVPGRRWLTFLEALHLTIYDRQPGAARQPLLDAGPDIGKIGAALCYESSYGWLTREQAARGAGILVVATDDTWFGRTAAARQHAAASAVRAVESDRYLVRAAATGISQIIAPTGQVLTEADLFEPKVISAPVESRRTVTPYVRLGDWFVVVCALELVWAFSARARGRKTARSSGR